MGNLSDWTEIAFVMLFVFLPFSGCFAVRFRNEPLRFRGFRGFRGLFIVVFVYIFAYDLVNRVYGIHGGLIVSEDFKN